MSAKLYPFTESELKDLIAPYLSSPFVFLETAYFDLENNRSFLFSKFDQILTFKPSDDLGLFFEKVGNCLKKGFWAAGFFSYEFGYFLEPSLSHLKYKSDSFPLAWLGISKQPLVFYHSEGNLAKENKSRSLSYKLENLKPNLSRKEYASSLRRIKRYIEEGLTYQVNFTFKYKFDFRGDILKFYLNLRRAQPTSYMALINTGEDWVLSLSPELFFRLNKDEIKVRPMKGTASRAYLREEDVKRNQWLKKDLKNRAENVMIVDLLRNDLGRISEPGGVKVESLFEVERYRTLHQMTSTIKSSLKKGTCLKEIFRALFPSGSVTGAPKISTMNIIAELEKESRRIYTGAIGYISPQNEACFNVAIRTILLREGKGEMGVGGGIVYDSQEDSEYREAGVKAGFLLGKFSNIQLIETIRWEKEKGFWLLDLHLKRIAGSAEYFQIPLDIEELKRRLNYLSRNFSLELCKVRVLLDLEGRFQISYRKLEDIVLPVKVKVSSRKIDPANLYLYHKTTHRHLYDRERALAKKEGFFEVIFTNTRGELTEGSISNIFLLLDNDKLLTPPLSSGLLPGVLREFLLRKGSVIEKVLYLDDIWKAKKVYIGNSVRGLLPAEVWLEVSPSKTNTRRPTILIRGGGLGHGEGPGRGVGLLE